MADSLLQYLLEGDILGFVTACYTTRIGQGFYAFLMMLVFGILYNRTKSLSICGITWLLIGFALVATMPVISPVVVIFITLGFSGILYDLVGSRR